MFYLILRVIWFVPGLLYRFSLKSTAWLWCWFAYFGAEPKRAKEPELFRRQVMCSDFTRDRRIVAWASILVFAAINAAHFLYEDYSIIDQPMPTIVVMFLLFGVNAVPWQWTGVLSATTALGVRYWIQHASIKLDFAKEIKNQELEEKAQTQFFWIEKLSRAGQIFAILYSFGAFGHLALLANSQHCRFSLPDNVQSWARAVYGNFAPLPPSCLAPST